MNTGNTGNTEKTVPASEKIGRHLLEMLADRERKYKLMYLGAQALCILAEIEEATAQAAALIEEPQRERIAALLRLVAES